MTATRTSQPPDDLRPADPTSYDDAPHPVLARLTRQTELAADVRQAAAWALSSRIAAQVLQFVGVLVTARLLLPEDYGKFAVVYPVVGFAAIFTSLGLDSAVIHARRITEQTLSTAFWLNALSGVVLTLLFVALSQPLAALFREDELVGLICLASLGYTLNLGIVHTALLERTLRFKQIAVIELSANLAGFAAVAVTAALGAGAYSLVLGPLLRTVIVSASVWSVVRWRPHRWLDVAEARELWRYTRGVMGFQAVTFWSRNADTLLLARFVSQASLGNYNRAYNLMRMPVDQTVVMMSRVLFPALTRLRDDRARMGSAWMRAMAVAVMFTAPAALVVAVAAPSVVEVLLGTRWLGMVPVLQMLSLAALPHVISASSLGLLRATGDTGTLFRLGLLGCGLTLVAVVAGLPWGTEGVAAALLLKFCLDVPIVVRTCARVTGLRQREVYRCLRGVVLACAALVTVGLLPRLATDGTPVPAWELLLTQGSAAVAAYAGVLWLVDRNLVRTAVSIVRRRALT